MDTPGGPPELIAHRGWASRWPENTLEGLVAAARAGARLVEFDIQLTADGVPMLLHDAALERTTGRGGDIRELSAAALAGIPAGEPARFGDTHADLRIPRLADVARAMAGLGIWCFPEVKTDSLERFGTRAVLEGCMSALAPLAGRLALTSFDLPALEEARDRHGVHIAWVLARYDEDNLARARALAPDYLFCNHEKLPPGDDPLPRGPWDWALYEVTDAGLALALARRGARYIETMAVGELLADPRLGARAP